MKKTAFTVTMVAIMAMALATTAFSQSGTAKSDKPASQPMMMQGQTESRQMSMMDMSKDYELISDDFAKIEDHVNKMMSMSDMKALKKELQQHQQMLLDLRTKMANHERLCMRMGTTTSGEMPGHMMHDMPGKTMMATDSSRGTMMQNTK